MFRKISGAVFITELGTIKIIPWLQYMPIVHDNYFTVNFIPLFRLHLKRYFDGLSVLSTDRSRLWEHDFFHEAPVT